MNAIRPTYCEKNVAASNSKWRTTSVTIFFNPRFLGKKFFFSKNSVTSRICVYLTQEQHKNLYQTRRNTREFTFLDALRIPFSTNAVSNVNLTSLCKMTLIIHSVMCSLVKLFACSFAKIVENIVKLQADWTVARDFRKFYSIFIQKPNLIKKFLMSNYWYNIPLIIHCKS